MDLISFKTLLSPAGQAALQAAVELKPTEVDFLSHLNRLNRTFPTDLARSALETAILRQEASSKFPQADQMYFTRAAMEQASSFPISTYRAERFHACAALVDSGCSIGGDTIALAEVAPTLGIDLDPLRLAMGRENLRSLGLSQQTQLLLADLNQGLPVKTSPGTGLFFDPARREGHRRVFSVKSYHPALEIIRGWLKQTPNIGVKISPAVNLTELTDYDAEIEFISLQGELKEAVLWFGELKTTRRRATLLPGQSTMAEFSSETVPPILPVTEPGRYIYEPDPAILRAGLVRQLGSQLEANQMDPEIAYLTTDRLIATPFARSWMVETWQPFQLKRLRQALRERRVGRVTIKKRGSPLQPEALIHDLRLNGPEERVVFLTHLRGRPIVIIAWPRPAINPSGLDL